MATKQTLILVTSGSIEANLTLKQYLADNTKTAGKRTALAKEFAEMGTTADQRTPSHEDGRLLAVARNTLSNVKRMATVGATAYTVDFADVPKTKAGKLKGIPVLKVRDADDMRAPKSWTKTKAKNRLVKDITKLGCSFMGQLLALSADEIKTLIDDAYEDLAAKDRAKVGNDSAAQAKVVKISKAKAATIAKAQAALELAQAA